MATENDKPLLIELTIRVKTYDVDWVGHVNNIVYIRWLEDLRLHFLDTHFPLEPLRDQGVAPIIVSTNIHYKKGIALSDRHVQAQMWVEDLGKAAFYLGARFLVGEDVCCTAQQRGTFVDRHKMRPIRIPAQLREAFEAHRRASA